jgi:TolB protein
MQTINRGSSLSRLTIFFSLALLLILFSLPAAAKRIELDIASSGVRKLAVAVPPFTGSRAGRDMARMLVKGLEFHGFVRIIDAQGRAGDKTDWRSLGVDYVVFGAVSQQGGTMTLEGALLDVPANKMLSPKRFSGPASEKDDLALRLADALVKDFTGEPGISRSSVAFVSDVSGSKEIYIADVLGRHIRQVTRHNHLCVSPRFSPDGRLLAYSSYHRGNQNLYVTDLNQNRLTKALSRRDGMNLAPAFAPDGGSMIVTLSKDGNPDLYLLDMQGKILERLTRRNGINVSPSYAPDGRSICFVSDRSGRPQVYLMNLRSRRSRLLTLQGRENVEPSWSPRGDKIVYTSLTGGHYHIFTIPAKGGSPTRITSGSGDYESPSWSPDGRQIAFSRKKNGRMEICAAMANGKGERVLFRLPGNQSYPRWSPRSR